MRTMTNLPLNEQCLYVTDADVMALPPIGPADQVLAVLAPHGTTLEVPEPDQEPEDGGRLYRWVARTGARRHWFAHVRVCEGGPPSSALGRLLAGSSSAASASRSRCGSSLRGSRWTTPRLRPMWCSRLRPATSSSSSSRWETSPQRRPSRTPGTRWLARTARSRSRRRPLTTPTWCTLGSCWGACLQPSPCRCCQAAAPSCLAAACPCHCRRPSR